MTQGSISTFISNSIETALRSSLPVVALESTVITHGLPRPQNLGLAREMEKVVRDCGATPATIAVLQGVIRVGLTDAELASLAMLDNVRKISSRDFATAVLKKESGGTTVAGTMFAAHHAGITVFATGGIGGVHDLVSLDISTDLQALGDTPMIVVCAGAKAILNLPATLEYLETMAVPVVGYATEEFPAFYSRNSGLNTSLRLNSALEVVQFARLHWSLGMKSAVLVCQPLPPDDEIPREKIGPMIDKARADALSQGISGQALTPFLLARLNDLTQGASLKANLALLKNNARLAAQIAQAWSKS